MKLPVFDIASTVAPAEHIRDLGKHIFPAEDQEVVERGTRVELRSKLGKIEVDVGRGGVWASDASRLWRFNPRSELKPKLVSQSDAKNLSSEVLTNYSILPNIAAPFRTKPIRTTGAVTAYIPKRGATRQTIQEDITVLTDIEVDVSTYGISRKTLPIVGGGGRFGVVLGDGGRLLATRGVWRPVVGRPKLFEVVQRTKTDEIYRAMLGNTPVIEFSSELAYYSAPAFSNQNQLYPVYVYKGIAKYGEMEVPLRKVVIPATEIGPLPKPSLPRIPRRSTTGPSIRPLPADFRPQPGQPLPLGVTVNRRLLAEKGIKFSDIFVESPVGAALIIKPTVKPFLLKEFANLLGYYSAGTSWIGLSGGLGGSQNNAQGFVDELNAIGWNIRFNWGDADAWESDWRQNDDDWVDAVDFVFYTGHAGSDGWVLAQPDDTSLHFSETAGTSDMWGAKNLEWAVIAACGPLQDEAVGSGGNVLDRWKDAFDGLHILMGYAQVTFDNEEEGRRLAQYAKAGDTIIQSWFRTGQEIQNGTQSDPIWVGAYYLGDSNNSTANDQLWGIGSVGPDITNPTWRACSWVPC